MKDNFKDEDVIKGLEVCSAYPQTCRGCPYLESGAPACLCKLTKNAYDLINRQKAEIERLKKRNTLLLKNKCKDINTAKKIIKSEAVKEFAERLCKGRVENDPVVIATKAELDYVLGVGLEVQK